MRKNNAESARQYRERKRQEEVDVRKAFETNEKRIEMLESMVHSLSSELDTPRVRGTQKSGKAASRHAEKISDSKQPEWFGQPF